MSRFFPSTSERADEKEKERDLLRQGKKAVRLIRSGQDMVTSARIKDPRKFVESAVIAGIKLAAQHSVFYNPSARVLDLYRDFQHFGIGALAWSPETLMAEIDKKYGDWTQDRAVQALEHFHKTGLLDTEVPPLVRQKLYAMRVVITSDSAHTEWNIFEKVGAAFNDRLADFSNIQQMSAAECARTVALMEALRPDSYTNEVKIYIGACCHEDGFYTVEPSKYLKMAEAQLQQANYESTGEPVDVALKQKITAKYAELKQESSSELAEAPDDILTVQALKLRAVDRAVNEAL